MPKSVEIVVVLHLLNFDDNPLFLVLGKNIVLEIDIAEARLKRFFGFDNLRVNFEAQNILHKRLEHNHIGKGFFEKYFIVEPRYLHNSPDAILVFSP
jgi:hypothetical protein